jgi:hypothetical protein
MGSCKERYRKICMSRKLLHFNFDINIILCSATNKSISLLTSTSSKIVNILFKYFTEDSYIVVGHTMTNAASPFGNYY